MNIEKLENAVINDDLNAINQLKTESTETDAFLRTSQFLSLAAAHGSKDVLTDMLKNNDWSDDAKYDAMTQAYESKQIESILVLGSQGENVALALSGLAKEPDTKPMIDRIVNELNYEPSKEDVATWQAWTTNAQEKNGYGVDMSYITNSYEQKAYKQAYKNFITNAEMTDGMDDQKAMLSASATGTAAHIDHYISIGDKANNEHWLKNLDVACHFGNNETAKRLVEHGANVSDDNIKTAQKFLKPETVEVLTKAKQEQVKEQTFSLSDKPKQTHKKERKQGLSLS